MELQYLGDNCLKIKTRDTIFVVNPSGADTKSTGEEAVYLLTEEGNTPVPEKAKLLIKSPGEYEVSEVSIKGITAQNTENSGQSTVYKFMYGSELRIVYIGHINPKLTDEQLSEIDGVDILFLPIGGDDKTTFGPHGAMEVIKELEPKVVIPSFYKESAKQSGAQLSLDEALTQINLQVDEKTQKYKPRVTDFGEKVKVINLEAVS